MGFSKERRPILSPDEKFSTVESLTAGRWIDGKIIYRKVIALGALPVGTSNYAHGLTGIGQILNVYGYGTNGSTTIFFPDSTLSVTADATNVTLQSILFIDYTTYSGHAVIEYTKA